jgi:hypothetical protein
LNFNESGKEIKFISHNVGTTMTKKDRGKFWSFTESLDWPTNIQVSRFLYIKIR